MHRKAHHAGDLLFSVKSVTVGQGAMLRCSESVHSIGLRLGAFVFGLVVQLARYELWYIEGRVSEGFGGRGGRGTSMLK